MSKLSMNEYQKRTRETAIYSGANEHGIEGINYTTLGLVGEAGEIANQFKKVIRDSNGLLSDAKAVEMLAELGDVLWYVARLADELGMPLEEVAERNLDKLNSRMERGVISGSGDNR